MISDDMKNPKPEPENKADDPIQEPPKKPEVKDSGHASNGNGNAGGVVSQSESETKAEQSPDFERVASPGSLKKSVHWSPRLVTESSSAPFSHGSNPYLSQSPTTSPSFNFKDTVETVRNVLWRWGKRVGETTKKAEDLAGNTWQHLKTSPSFAEAAMGRIAQGTKVLAEGGYEKIFQQTFETFPEEQLLNSYACYLSTSAGPVMGVLYISTAKLAYSSDNPLSYKSGNQTEWSYYKVVIPLHQLKAVNPSSSRLNPAEKYIQVISVDNHEFWFMGFLNYEGAVQCLQEASQTLNFESA